LGKPAPKYKAAYSLLLVAAAFEQAKCWLLKKEPGITFESIKSGSRTTHYNGEKIKQYLPDFSYTPIEECIKFTAERYLTQSA
jgi:hypothetical protein